MTTPFVMMTDGGVHSAGAWALQTVSQLISIDPASQSAAAIAGRRLELKLLDLLEASHDAVQKNERARLAADPHALLAAPVTPEIDTVDELVAAIAALAVDTPFAGHYAAPETQAAVKSILEQNFAVSMDIERSTWADANRGHPTVDAYVAARRDRGFRHAHLHMQPAAAAGAAGGRRRRPALAPVAAAGADPLGR